MSIRVVQVYVEKREDDPMGVMRISAGGSPETKFYLRFRGAESDIEKLLRLLNYEFANNREGDQNIKIEPFVLNLQGDTADTLRISAGGIFGIGLYLQYQGDPPFITELLSVLLSAFEDYQKKNS